LRPVHRREALADAAECWREVRADDTAHGASGEEPFCNFVAVDGVAIFTFYGASVDFYVVRGDEWDFRGRFDPLAMTEVDAARAILRSDFGRPAPDLVMSAQLSREWLS
jgi:hypothetical protein